MKTSHFIGVVEENASVNSIPLTNSPESSFGLLVLSLHPSVYPCVRVSVYQSLACSHDNSRPVQARATKFGPNVQNTLVKVSILKGLSTLIFKVKFDFKIQMYPILSLSAA